MKHNSKVLDKKKHLKSHITNILIFLFNLKKTNFVFN